MATETIKEPVPGSGATLRIDVPRSDRAFLSVFNLSLLVAGLLAIVAVVAIALLLSSRLTRPLQGVAAAAQRLGHGDLSARASGGPDRESNELAAAFNAMAERVQRSEMLRRRAASDMAHDLATPATVLESQLQAMVDGVVPADREQLDRARAAAGALSGVIAQLGELVDAESGVLQRRPRLMPLARPPGRGRAGHRAALPAARSVKSPSRRFPPPCRLRSTPRRSVARCATSWPTRPSIHPRERRCRSR